MSKKGLSENLSVAKSFKWRENKIKSDKCTDLLNKKQDKLYHIFLVGYIGVSDLAGPKHPRAFSEESEIIKI